MKKVKVNGISVNVFEELELREKLKKNDKEINLIIKYQKQFPELLQENKGFCIDGRKLWINLNEPQGSFADFAKRDIVENVFKEKGKKTKDKKYIIDVDYIIEHKIPNNFDESKVGNVDKMNKTQLSRYGISTEYKLTVNCAKKISIQQGNKIGDIIQDYFIVIEDTLRNYEGWNIVRGVEKSGWNNMTDCIEAYCIRKGLDHTIRKFYTREANLLNQSLLGYTSSEINWMLKNDDRLTRNHLTTDINDAITYLQELNCSLLFADMGFEERTQIIQITCMNKYSRLKIEFLNIVI